ncbi:ATP-binding protein [Oleisolibacter albus]|uniref:ATP-binding protein n=1 Tax=Oleisolibacter albus TaxID=2171757 RepID=UPI000DF4B4E1|nr:ATP-binding protein [Oleisolibacter albus]
MPDVTAASALSPASLWRRRPRLFRWIKRFLPRTLFARSLLIMMTPVVLAQAIATFVFYDRHWQTITNRLAYGVVGDIAFTIEQLQRDATPAERATTMAMARRSTDLSVHWNGGAHLPPGRQRVHSLLDSMLAKALDERIGRPWRINTRIGQERVEIRVQLPDGVLTVISPERRLYSFTSYLFILWMIGSSLVLFAVAILFMRNQIRPIRRLAAAADAFGKGRDAPAFRPEGASEVRQAALAFLVMRERIRRQISQRTEMLAGVSHDLRTPLTRMKLQLAMLPDLPEAEELKADVADMETMIDGYLAFASGEGAEAPQPVDLTRMVEEIAANARREGTNLTLALGAENGAEGELGEEIILPLRPVALRRCITNLVSNARRYGTNVWLTLLTTATVIDIVVEDDGPGIPADKRGEVFRPFHRLEPSRNSSTGGVGLGLSIARDAARLHGGEILLSDSPHGGLKATVRLPR